MTLIKSISGIRGTIGGPAGDTLNPLDIVKFTSAYATFIRRSGASESNIIVVGRDARISGEMVKNVVCGTLMGMGYDVLNIGLATTPTTELAVTMSGAAGGIIITASHNPRQTVMPSALLWDGLVIFALWARKLTFVCRIWYRILFPGCLEQLISCGMTSSLSRYNGLSMKPTWYAVLTLAVRDVLMRWTMYCWVARLSVSSSTTIWLLILRLSCWFRSHMPAVPATWYSV